MTAGIGSRQLSTNEGVAIGTRQDAEPAAQFVDAVPAQFALVVLLDLLAAAAALAGGSDPGFQRGELLGLASGERCGCGIDEAEQLGAQLHDRRAGAIESCRQAGERVASPHQARIGGQHAVPW